MVSTHDVRLSLEISEVTNSECSKKELLWKFQKIARKLHEIEVSFPWSFASNFVKHNFTYFFKGKFAGVKG